VEREPAAAVGAHCSGRVARRAGQAPAGRRRLRGHPRDAQQHARTAGAAGAHPAAGPYRRRHRSDAMKALLDRLATLLRANRRLRIGCALIVAIVVADAMLAAQDGIDRGRAGLAVDLARLGRLEALARQPDWVDAAARTSRSLVAVRRLAWSQETEGLMEA